jgi:hypothetical protein
VTRISPEQENECVKLANLLSRRGGTREQHMAFLRKNIDRIKLEALIKLPEGAPVDKVGWKCTSIAISWWDTHWSQQPRSVREPPSESVTLPEWDEERDGRRLSKAEAEAALRNLEWSVGKIGRKMPEGE